MTEKQRMARAQEYFQEAKQHLRKLARVENSNGSAYHSRGYFPGSGDFAERMGGFNVPYGVEPNDADVRRFIDSVGGNPYMRRSGGNAPPGSSQSTVYKEGYEPKEREKPGDVLRKLMESFQSDRDAANEANLARYDEGKGIYQDLLERNQGRVDNWGRVAEQQAREQYDETLGDVQANLASRGMGNSTVGDAFRMRSASDLNTQLQRISEARDDRASQYDTRDSGALAQFIERRNDIGPDPSLLAGLAQQIGQFEQFNQMEEQRLAQQQAGAQQQGGYAPSYPRAIGGAPIFMDGPQFQLPYFQGASGSNRRPQSRRERGLLSDPSMQAPGSAQTANPAQQAYPLVLPGNGLQFPIYA